MSLHDPISRKREVELDSNTIEEFRNKRMKGTDLSSPAPSSTSALAASSKKVATKVTPASSLDTEFSEKMYHQYVKSAFAALEKVCPEFFFFLFFYFFWIK